VPKEVKMQNRQRGIGVVVENGIDMCLNISALAMAYIFAVLFKVPESVSFDSPRTMMIMFLVVLLQSFVFQGLNLYRPLPFAHPSVMLGKIFRANVVYYLIVEFLCVLAFDESREFMLVWMLISAVISTAILLFKKRMMIRFIALFRKKQYSLRKVIIVGDNTFTAAEFVRQVANNSECGMMVLGYVGDRINEDVGCDKLGSFKDLASILDEYHPSDVVFAIDGYDKRRLIRLVNICDDKCIKVYFLPVIYGFFKSPRQIEPVGSLPVINIHSTPLDNRFNAFMKRVIDVLGSLALILLTAPIMLAAAVGVKISSPGPIFFRQERVGKMGKRFVMLKFRSMRVNVDSEKGWTKGNDPRKTRFGTFIRKTSIDELPQLFNVLFGTMSLVGPRPEVPHFVEYFRERIPLYMVKHYVKPGMTGLAQIKGLRGDTSISERISADISYIEGWSLLLDIQILLKTPFRMLNRSEIYTKGSGENEK
jgi:Undecaprenyl-phosphate glucose phosphotransferase